MLGRGISRSLDSGATWASIDAGLEGPELRAVRSLAVHPKEGSIVLRASGAAVEGKLRGWLLRSADGGRSWRVVSDEIDFSGEGPTAMFGEVVSFDPERPGRVAAGGENRGLFLSRDGGLTWEPSGLERERITGVAFVPHSPPNRPALIVATAADRELEALGLGRPSGDRLEAPGAIYWCELPDGKLKVRPSCRLDDLAVTNIAFGAHPNFATFATTRGIYYTWQHGNVFSQRRHRLPADRLFIALGYRQFMKEYRKDDWRLRSTTFAAPFTAPPESPVFTVRERTTGLWAPLAEHVEAPGVDASLGRGITGLPADPNDPEVLYLAGRGGVFKSADGGRSYARIYPP